MLLANFSVSKLAAPVLDQQMARLHLGNDDIAGMVYIEYFKESDGRPVNGFVPGYQLGSWKKSNISPEWLNIAIGSKFNFYLLPKFKWAIRNQYLIDSVGGDYDLFSISRVG
jgi:hypothetical protein